MAAQLVEETPKIYTIRNITKVVHLNSGGLGGVEAAVNLIN